VLRPFYAQHRRRRGLFRIPSVPKKGEWNGCSERLLRRRVIGGHQTVIKNLGTYYQTAEGISGATILGDGTVALILDVPKPLKAVEREERNHGMNDAHRGCGQSGGSFLRADYRQAMSMK
jgi:CheW-like domain